MAVFDAWRAFDIAVKELYKVMPNPVAAERRKEDTQLLDAVADLARLKTARSILRNVSVEYWTDAPSYIRKLQKIDALTPVKELIDEACHIIGKLTKEA